MKRFDTDHSSKFCPFLLRFWLFAKIKGLISIKIDVLSDYRHKVASEAEVSWLFGH